jgi:hypothetical protein
MGGDDGAVPLIHNFSEDLDLANHDGFHERIPHGLRGISVFENKKME